MPRHLVAGRLVLPDGVIPDGVVALEGERIDWVGPRADLPASWAEVARLPGWPQHAIITPGLIDLHCHGAGGAEFGAPGQFDSGHPVEDQVAAARVVAEQHRRHGTTRLVGSIVSNTHDHLELGVQALARLVASGELAGIHLEGPFLSVARCGAQNPDVLTDAVPDLVDRLAAAAADAGAPGGIVQMTMAPERDLNQALLERLIDAGVTPAIGHTDATAGQAAAALRRARELAVGVRGGRPLVTHLFNGMPPLHHRQPGPVSSALAAGARGDAVLEIIADGKHLAAETVAMVFDLAGAESLVLVTDAMSACCMPDGSYTLGGKEVRVADGEARLGATGSLAGSVATMADCLRFTTQVAGVDLAAAVRAATATPAVVLEGPGTLLGRLTSGAPAELVAFSDNLDVLAVLAQGIVTA